MTESEKILDRIRNEKLSDTELVDLTRPHYNQLKEQGEMRDNDTIDDKQLKVAQHPVTVAANAVVKLRLSQEQYRAKWDYKDTYKADKWAHKDKVRQMKRERCELVKSRKAARKAAKQEQCRKLQEEKAAKRAAKKVAKSEKAALDPGDPKRKKHSRE
ncbi:MAG: hypothetical protein K2L51_07245 [Clostridiales bacterium]|nr:hypothetical protein [Clostridiales bacterium]